MVRELSFAPDARSQVVELSVLLVSADVAVGRDMFDKSSAQLAATDVKSEAFH